jgi:hypothetical protein
MPQEEQILSGFSEFKHGKLLVEDCKNLHHPSTGHKDKNANKLHTITNITGWLAAYASHME